MPAASSATAPPMRSSEICSAATGAGRAGAGCSGALAQPASSAAAASNARGGSDEEVNLSMRPSSARVSESPLNARAPARRSAVEPGRSRQALRAQEFRVVELRLVARARVAEHGDDGFARAELPREADRPRDVDTRGAAEQQPLALQQVEADRHHLAVRNLERVVDLRAGEVARDPALADALADRAAARLELAGLDPAVNRRAHRVGRRRDDVR